jgi:hemerythrin
MLVWKDEYAVGVELIDAQHQRLFEIGNSAYKLLKDDFCTDKYDRIVQIIEELRQYTKFHFKSEEEYMMKINYRKYFSQKVEHDDFINKINAVNLDIVDENPEKYLEDILAFIFNWILDHILQKDKLIKSEA